jgi:hypothetical protein
MNRFKTDADGLLNVLPELTLNDLTAIGHKYSVAIKKWRRGEPMPILTQAEWAATRNPNLPLPGSVPPHSIETVGAKDWRDYFAGAWVVNMATRPERLAAFMAGVPSDWPFAPIERLEGVNGASVTIPSTWKAPRGAYGLYLTYRNLLTRAIDEGWDKPILLFEDDATLIPDFTAKATAAIANTPADWDLLFIGGGAKGPSRFGKAMNLYGAARFPTRPGIRRTANILLTHAWAISPRFFAPLRDLFDKFQGHVDVAINRVAIWHRVFICDPVLSNQRPGESDIAEGEWKWGGDLTGKRQSRPRESIIDAWHLAALKALAKGYDIEATPDGVTGNGTQMGKTCRDGLVKYRPKWRTAQPPGGLCTTFSGRTERTGQPTVNPLFCKETP